MNNQNERLRGKVMMVISDLYALRREITRQTTNQTLTDLSDITDKLRATLTETDNPVAPKGG